LPLAVLDVALLHLLLAPSDDVVDLAPDCLDLTLSIKASPHLFIGFNETLQFFLQTIVLVVQVSHVFIKGIYFSL